MPATARSLPAASRVVVFGGGGAGKTSFLWRYAYDDRPSSCVVGVDFVNRDDHPPPAGQPQALGRIQLWEMTGSERRFHVPRSILRGTVAVVILFDVSDASSLHIAQSWWASEIRKAVAELPKGQPRPSITLVANAVGRGGAGRAVATADVEAWATKFGVGYCECSTDSRESTERVIDVALSASEAYSPCFRIGAVRLPRPSRCFAETPANGSDSVAVTQATEPLSH